MINEGLEIIREEVQAFLDHKDSGNTRKVFVVASNTPEKDSISANIPGSKDIKDNQLFITLVNIEEERTLKSVSEIKDIKGKMVTEQNPPMHINIYILFAAFSSDYNISLSIISDLIGFFHSKPSFNHSNTASLHGRLEKIMTELVNLSFESQYHLWSFLGIKYSPSVLYKLRIIPG